MKFSLTTPCDNCPFRRDKPFGLDRRRVEEIATSLQRGDTFQCHKTIRTREDLDGHAYAVRTEKDEHCAGAAILLLKLDQPGQWMQISMRMGFFDPAKMDMKAPVYKTFAAFKRGAVKMPKGPK